MLAEHGTFSAMEIQLKKIHQKERSQTVGGGWCSEIFLRTEKKWDKPSPQYLSTMYELVNLKLFVWLPAHTNFYQTQADDSLCLCMG